MDLLIAAGVLFWLWRSFSERFERLEGRLEELSERLETQDSAPAPAANAKPEGVRDGSPAGSTAAPTTPPAQAPVPPKPKSILPPPPPRREPLRAPVAAAEPEPPIDWEKFLGVQLFAWLGGFALFLGAAFFVKYSIDHNLISPLMRVILAALVGLGAIGGGFLLRPKGYAVTVQTLCAAGISILYADVFACRSIYAFVGPEPAFLLMALITAASFALAVGLDSRYVAILGLVGGFLTPPLLSTGVDHPIALFAYVALLDAGVFSVALRKRWGFLVWLSAGATFAMQCGWTGKFFTAAKAELAVGIHLTLGALFLGARELFERQGLEADEDYHAPVAWFVLLSLAFAAHMLSYRALAVRPGLTLGYLLAAGGFSAYLAFRRENLRAQYMLAGLATFALLSYWTLSTLRHELLFWGLGFYMGFAALHAWLPLLLNRFRPAAGPYLYGYAAPVAMLVLILMAIIACDILSFILWPFVLALGLIALAMAWMAASVLAAFTTLALIMASVGIWLFRLPDAAGLPDILLVLAFFACGLFAWGLLIIRRPSLFPQNASLSAAGSVDPALAAQIPAMAALMPFILLGMVAVKLPLADPSQVFGLMLLMTALLLSLALYRSLGTVSLAALLAGAAVQYLWHFKNFRPEEFQAPLAWHLVFYAAFTGFPFVFHRRIKGRSPWLAAAFCGALYFPLLHRVFAAVFGRSVIGLLPAALALAPLAGVFFLIGNLPAEDERRHDLLAAWGGCALLFITLIFPVQFDKEWLTVGWALEGLALLWLRGRVAHEGLRACGVVLLLAAFARLALNPAVLSYHQRAAAPFLNWYLWAYGISIACLLAAARFFTPPEEKFEGWNMPPLLNGLATVLAFLLLNIEIADYFSTGTTITFQFSGSLARDMTYSLAWAAFATGLLVIGIRTGAAGARLASLGLLSATILKVFFHDLWRLGQLYRVASIVGLAVVLILVSFLYQKFLAGGANAGDT